MSKYVILDLEMCNVPYNDRRDWLNCNNEIIEIGAVLLDDSLKICDSFKTYVHPEYGVLDSVISDLTGITNGFMLRSARLLLHSNRPSSR